MSTDDKQTDEDALTAEVRAMVIWERHLEQATERWHEGVSRSADEYREGLADAMGVSPDDVPDEAVEHWQERVMETGPEEFATAIAGEGADWFTGMYERVTGKEPPADVRDLASELEREVLDSVGDDASDEEVAATVQEVVSRRRAEMT